MKVPRDGGLHDALATARARGIRMPPTGPVWSLALSEVSRPELLDGHLDVRAETPSITRLEGSRWRGGRLWSYKHEARVPE